MNVLDLHTITLINQLGHLSVILNKVLFYLQVNDATTWVPATSLLWWAWFRGNDQKINDRKIVVSLIISFILIVSVFIIIQKTRLGIITFRPRPLANLRSNFHMPYGIEIPKGQNWYWHISSSFPSGHGAILTVFSIGLLYISRPVSIVCMIYFLIICLLRVYFGIHYLTDIIAGALMGAALFYIANSNIMGRILRNRILKWSDTYPSLFYPAFFIITFEIANGFQEARYIIQLLSPHL